MHKQQKKKVRSRRKLQKRGEITANNAKKRITAKNTEELTKAQKRLDRQYRIIVNKDKAIDKRRGINTRKAERKRKKKVSTSILLLIITNYIYLLGEGATQSRCIHPSRLINLYSRSRKGYTNKRRTTYRATEKGCKRRR